MFSATFCLTFLIVRNKYANTVSLLCIKFTCGGCGGEGRGEGGVGGGGKRERGR